MNIPSVMKKYTKKGRWLVASTANFTRQKKGKYGLRGQCKECQKKYNNRYCKNNKEKIAEQHKQWREANKDKLAECNKRYRENNKEKIAERHKRYYENNKEKIVEQHKQYYEVNKEKILKKNRQYYKNNRDEILKQNKQYRETNRDKKVEYDKQYYKNNKDKVAKQHKQYHKSPQGQVSAFNRHHRRRVKEEQQGSGITTDQWLEMMSFFGWKCAYSGEILTKDTRSVDHIVPLNSNGDNMIWNCVPMARSLNSSKCAKDMLEWYKEQDFYDPKRLAKIYEWQEYARKKWKN